jgi:hypothetical protein
MVKNMPFQFIFSAILLLTSLTSTNGYSASRAPCAETKPKTLFLSSPRSGTNLLSCSLQAIIRKPIGVYPNKIHTIGTARLGLENISDIPFIYRSHAPIPKKKMPSDFSKIILLTRNPKELIFRFFSPSSIESINSSKVNSFLDEYISRFISFEEYDKNHRLLLFYEDLISQMDAVLLTSLEFLEEDPAFMEDYLLNKSEYLEVILSSYQKQHAGAHGGSSSLQGPTPIYYTKNKDPELLRYLDQKIKDKNPEIWRKYLKRFKTL